MAIFEGGPDLEWEADIAWVVRGGADPFEWIKTFGKRITAVHVKDIGAQGKTEEDGWADVGDGTMDWKGLMAALKGAPGKVFVMEHDNPSDRPASPSARSTPPSGSEAHMTDKLGIGIIGCGNISAAYFRLAPLFKGLEVRACSDLDMAAARRGRTSSTSMPRRPRRCSRTRPSTSSST